MTRNPSWPLVLWLSPLCAAVPVVAYAGLRLRSATPPGPLLGTVSVLAFLWIVLAVGVAASAVGRRWIHRRRLELAVTGGTLALTLVLADLALTLSGVVPTVAAIRDRSLEYVDSASSRHRLVPKTVESPGRPPVQINRWGLRGPEVEVPAPAGRIRLLFLGGSFVFDVDGGEWPRGVEDILRAAAHDVEVLNGGVPGHATADSLGKLVTALWQLEPDVDFVCHAWNDIKYFGQLRTDHTYRDFVGGFEEDWRIHPRGIDRWLSASAAYRLVRSQVVRRLIGEEGRRSRGRQQVGELGPAQYRLNLQTIVHVTRDIGAVPVLCKQPRLATADSSAADRERIDYDTVGLSHEQLIEAFVRADAIVDDVAVGNGVSVVDLHALLSGRSELFIDHIHLTAAGGQAAARVVADRLDELLGEMETRS